MTSGVAPISEHFSAISSWVAKVWDMFKQVSSILAKPLPQLESRNLICFMLHVWVIIDTLTQRIAIGFQSIYHEISRNINTMIL